MGIRGLQKLMQTIPNGQRLVKIITEIEAWKLINPKEKCLIVIDLYGIRGSYIFKDYINDLLCGFRHNNVYNVIESFLKQLHDAGAELAFFVNGFNDWNSVEYIVEKQYYSFHNDQHLFRVLASGKPLDEMKKMFHVDEEYNILDHEIGYSYRSLVETRTLLEKYGTLHNVSKGKCDRAMALYANRNKAFAVLTNDSDLIVFSGNWKLWNTHYLDINNLTIFELNKSALLAYLQIGPHYLPIMATLLGSKDQFSFDLASIFHTRLGKFFQRFTNIANYIKRNNIHSSSTNYNVELFKIAKKIDSYNPAGIQAMMLKSIEYYECRNINEDTPEIKTKLRHLGTLGYDLHSFPVYITKSRLCNYKKLYEFPSHNDAMISIIRRAHGFIWTLFNANRDVATKKIITKENYKSPYEMKSYEAVYPSSDVKYPMYPAFYEDFTDDATKMKILFWIFEIDDSKYEKILELPDTIAPALFCILYFTERGLIDEDVADTCLITNYAEAFGLIPSKVEYPKHVDEKLNTFSRLYCLIYHYLIKCARMVNIPELCMPYKFDAVYFQLIHQQYVNDSTDKKRIEMMENIQPYRYYVSNEKVSDSLETSLTNEILKLEELSLDQKE